MAHPFMAQLCALPQYPPTQRAENQLCAAARFAQINCGFYLSASDYNTAIPQNQQNENHRLNWWLALDNH
jgi:hypothetical protein